MFLIIVSVGLLTLISGHPHSLLCSSSSSHCLSAPLHSLPSRLVLWHTRADINTPSSTHKSSQSESTSLPIACHSMPCCQDNRKAWDPLYLSIFKNLGAECWRFFKKNKKRFPPVQLLTLILSDHQQVLVLSPSNPFVFFLTQCCPADGMCKMKRH